MKKRSIRIMIALLLTLTLLSALSCGAGKEGEGKLGLSFGNAGAEADENVEKSAVLTYVGVRDGQIELMTAEGDIMRFSYSSSNLTHTTEYPFPCYTSVGSVMKLADISAGQRMNIRYTGGDLTEIFAKKQYKKIREMRQIDFPEESVRQFGVVREVGEDCLLVYLGRCDDITDVDPADCIYVPIRNVPIVPDGFYWVEEQPEIKIEVGTYVSVFHSGEVAERTLGDVYSVKVCPVVVTKQFTVSALRSNDILIDNMVLGHWIFEDGEIFENGQPVALDSIRLGDVIEVEWNGVTLTSSPGQFGAIYAARVVKRTDTAEYLGVVKENCGDHLLVYFSGADRVHPRDLVNDIFAVENGACIRVPLTGVTLVSGTDRDAVVLPAEIAGGDRVWVSYTGDGFENAPNEKCAVSRVIRYERRSIMLNVTEIKEKHIIMSDASGRVFSLARSDAAHNFRLYENGNDVSFESLKAGDRIEADYAGEAIQFNHDGSYYFPNIFAVRVVERAG